MYVWILELYLRDNIQTTFNILLRQQLTYFKYFLIRVATKYYIKIRIYRKRFKEQIDSIFVILKSFRLFITKINQ